MHVRSRTARRSAAGCHQGRSCRQAKPGSVAHQSRPTPPESRFSYSRTDPKCRIVKTRPESSDLAAQYQGLRIRYARATRPRRAPLRIALEGCGQNPGKLGVGLSPAHRREGCVIRKVHEHKIDTGLWALGPANGIGPKRKGLNRKCLTFVPPLQSALLRAGASPLTSGPSTCSQRYTRRTLSRSLVQYARALKRARQAGR